MSPPRLGVYRRARQQGLCVIDSTSFMHMQHAVHYPQMPLLAALLEPPRLFGRIPFGRSTRFSPTHFRQRRKSALSRPCREENSAGALPALPALPQTEQRMLRSRRSSPAEARSELLLAVVGTSPPLARTAGCRADAAMDVAGISPSLARTAGCRAMLPRMLRTVLFLRGAEDQIISYRYRYSCTSHRRRAIKV